MDKVKCLIGLLLIASPLIAVSIVIAVEESIYFLLLMWGVIILFLCLIFLGMYLARDCLGLD